MHKPKWLSFRSKGQLKFTEEMREAFSACVGSIVAVPVEGVPGRRPRYVFEVDIAPHSSLCREHVFYYCDPEGKAVAYMRDGSSNVKSSSYRDKKGNVVFEGLVGDRIRWACIIFSTYYKLISTAFSQKSYYFQPKGLSR